MAKMMNFNIPQPGVDERDEVGAVDDAVAEGRRFATQRHPRCFGVAGQ